MNRTRVQAYLSRYAEPEAFSVRDFSGTWSHAICIPACNEDPSFQQTLDSILKAHGGEKALLILVVNGAQDGDFEEANKTFLTWIRQQCTLLPGPMALGKYRELDVLLVDRASPGVQLPERQGVGLARKITGDIALSLWERGDVASPWFLCTDADVQVPVDYLEALPPDHANLSAALFPFEHILEGDAFQQEAMCLYESYLHYYVLGLHWAGSPYAHHSIGSLFAIHGDAYAAVRGFPKRRAGEDFYLLNKLIKVAPLLPLNAGRIKVRGRRSNRVPFGTGAALNEISSIRTEGIPYTVYDPQVFLGVQTWQRALTNFAYSPDLARLQQETQTENTLPENLLHGCLEEMGAYHAAESASRNTKMGLPLLRRLHEWNDAFRTLKLVHALRDKGLPSIELHEAIEQAPFVQALASENPMETMEAIRNMARSVCTNKKVGLHSLPSAHNETLGH
jgi:hypothetical protein